MLIFQKVKRVRRVAIIPIFILFLLPLTSFSLPPSPLSPAMVVTDHALASRVGLEILKKGGNAIDAAVAIGYALAVVQPCCGNLGGGGFMLIHFNQDQEKYLNNKTMKHPNKHKTLNNKTIFLNFREKAPLAATPTMFANMNSKYKTEGYLAVAVPGTVLGLETALQRYGTLSREEILMPAIELAKNGFILKTSDINMLLKFTEDFRKTKNVSDIFLKPVSAEQAVPYQAGDRLIQRDLSNTLQLILEQGLNAFYEGNIAKQIVQASTTQGGILTLNDFKQYKKDALEELKPLSCQYRDHHIITSPLPSSGGIVLCEMLKQLEPYPLNTLKFQSEQSILHIVEAMKQGFLKRNQLGNSLNTTHYAVIDKEGNIVLVTYSLNSLFGAKVIAGNTGFFLNNEMDDFTTELGLPNQFGLIQGEANKIEPGKTPLSSMSPTLVFKNNQPYLALGAAGGPRIITANLQTLLNVVDYGMTLEKAVNAPRFHYQGSPDSIEAEPLSISPKIKKNLKRKGYKIVSKDELGIEEAFMITPNDPNKIEGVCDKRRPGGAVLEYTNYNKQIRN